MILLSMTVNAVGRQLYNLVVRANSNPAGRRQRLLSMQDIIYKELGVDVEICRVLIDDQAVYNFEFENESDKLAFQLRYIE